MKIITSFDEYCMTAIRMIKKTKDTPMVSTFGMYLNTEHKPMRNLLDLLKRREAMILIGLPTYSPCKPRCNDCLNRFNSRLTGLAALADALDIDAQFANAIHMKCVVSGTHVISGGFNLSCSDFFDTALYTSNAGVAKRYESEFNDLWVHSAGDITSRMKHCECGGSYVLRNGKHGWFYGCRSFPECMNTVTLIS